MRWTDLEAAERGAGHDGRRKPRASRGARRRPAAAIAAALVLLLGADPASAQFQEPRVISRTDATISNYSLAVDPFDNVVLALQEGDQVWLRTLLTNGEEQEVLVADAAGEPDLLFRTLGLWIATAERPAGAEGETEARQIRVRSGFGTQLNRPVDISSPEETARAPDLGLSPSRQVVVAWERHSVGPEGDASVEIVLAGEELAEHCFGPGTSPSVEVDANGRIHLFFSRDERVWYTTNAGELDADTFRPPEEVAPELAASPAGPRSGLSGERDLHLLFKAGDVLFLLRNDVQGGGFGEPRRIEEGVDEFDLSVNSLGVQTIAFTKEGNLWHTLGNDLDLPEAQPVEASADVEARRPMGASDNFANAFVTYLVEGDLHLTTNAGVPIAEFDVSTTEGEFPLEVSFSDLSRGNVTGWEWDFGDGHRSFERNPTHTFRETGEFRVRLTVQGPGGPSMLRAERRIIVSDARNLMWVADIRTVPGAEGVYIPVLVTHEQDAQGFQVAGRFDPEVLEVVDIVFENTNVGNLEPEVAAFQVSHEPDDAFFTAGILFDIRPPFDRRTLHPGRAQRVANLVVNVRPGVTPETDSFLVLVNGIGTPPLNNIITSNSQSVLPALGNPARIAVESVSFPPPRYMVRGDVDDNGTFNLSDAVQILNFLFGGGPDPTCLDAADVTDDGLINISDASFALNFLFLAGPYPLPPYPVPGLDPTPDDIPDCTFF